MGLRSVIYQKLFAPIHTVVALCKAPDPTNAKQISSLVPTARVSSTCTRGGPTYTNLAYRVHHSFYYKQRFIHARKG